MSKIVYRIIKFCAQLHNRKQAYITRLISYCCKSIAVRTEEFTRLSTAIEKKAISTDVHLEYAEL